MNKTNWKNKNGNNKRKSRNTRKTRKMNMRKGGDSSTDIFNRVMDNPHPK
jgi:hypothetical protein